MNDKIKKHLVDYCDERGLGFDPTEPKQVLEVLQNLKPVYKKFISSHRWYDEYLYVVDLGGLSVGYGWVHMTGDDSPYDMDIDFDTATVQEMKPVEKTVTVYEPVDK